MKHLEIQTSELDQSSYSKNPKNRCFACKKELLKHTTYLSKKLNFKIVLDGVNLDDIKDYRPGIKAAKQAGLFLPLQNLISQNKTLGIYQELWDFHGGINPLSLACLQDSLMAMKSLVRD